MKNIGKIAKKMILATIYLFFSCGLEGKSAHSVWKEAIFGKNI